MSACMCACLCVCVGVCFVLPIPFGVSETRDPGCSFLTEQMLRVWLQDPGAAVVAADPPLPPSSRPSGEVEAVVEVGEVR